MKLRITLDGNPLAGYTNCLPKRTLDEVADGECTEILATDLTNFVPSSVLYEVLTNYVKKLRHKGKIILGGTDAIILANEIVRQRINLVEANNIIFGEKDAPKKGGLVSLSDATELLQSFGLKILSKKIDGINFIVEAQRP